MKSVQFTYLIGGKKITVFDRKTIGAMLHGHCTTPQLKTEVETVFLVIDRCPAPIPITETEEQVITLLNQLENS